MLYLVGTPIGNMSDISSRVVEVLSSVDVVACEDTRRTGLLLSNLNIKKRLISYHEHNRTQRGAYLLSLLESGLNIALVSDAGMPCISDPGEDLVRLCADNHIEIQAVSGPVAGVLALALSGLDSRRWIFEGFLPAEGKDRKLRLQELTLNRQTFILYEAPHRLLKTLSDLIRIDLGQRQIAVCRELTKKYEEVLRFTVEEALEHFTIKPPKGEFVLVVAGSGTASLIVQPSLTPQEQTEKIKELIVAGYSTKDMTKQLAEEWQLPKKTVYALILEVEKQSMDN